MRLILCPFISKAGSIQSMKEVLTTVGDKIFYTVEGADSVSLTAVHISPKLQLQLNGETVFFHISAPILGFMGGNNLCMQERRSDHGHGVK